MKYLKYLTLSLFACMVMSSCEKQEVEFNWTDPVGAQFQLWNFVAKGQAFNYAIVGGQDLSNNHGTFLAKNNFVPSGSTGRFYQTPAGTVNLTLGIEIPETIKKENGEDSVIYIREDKYAQSVQLENGKQYQLFLYDYTKAPKVVEHIAPPLWSATDSLGDGNHAAIKLINMMYEDENTPSEGKYIQAWLKSYDAATKTIGEVFYKSKPVPFGDVSEWMEVELVKTALIDQGSQRIYVDLHEVTADGQDLGLLKYYNANGAEKVFENDYWTTYYGRATYWVVYGTRDASQSEIAISLLYAR